MTWKEVACVVAALCLPVLCGLSPSCSAGALTQVIALSGLVASNIVVNASNRSRARLKKKTKKIAP